jgi:cyclic pyranopterin phosphate synthase
MVNVGEKKISKRCATAEGIVRVESTTIEKIKKDKLPKGDLFGTARIAGIMAAKKTSELIPLCHNLLISSVKIEIKLVKNDIYVLSSVKCDGKTGVEMEALTAVSVSCLTIYDMLKGLDKNAFIANIQLLEKSGGKSGDWKKK